MENRITDLYPCPFCRTVLRTEQAHQNHLFKHPLQLHRLITEEYAKQLRKYMHLAKLPYIPPLRKIKSTPLDWEKYAHESGINTEKILNEVTREYTGLPFKDYYKRLNGNINPSEEVIKVE